MSRGDKLAKSNSINHEGSLYYSEETAAKMLGITKPALKKIMISDCLDWCNFKENGPIWISVSSINLYRNHDTSAKRKS